MRPVARFTWIASLVGAVVGVVYGLSAYAMFDRSGGVMVLSFLLLVPFALGVVAGVLTRREEGFRMVLVRSVLSVTAFGVASLLLAWEGLICFVFALPLLYGSAILGGTLGFFLRRPSSRAGSVMLALTAPFAVAPFERSRPLDATYRTTQNSIVIDASPSEVWRQIRSVPRIREEELTTGWSHAIGLPRPIAAELDREGVGGVRTATFADGLSFHETVTEWMPDRRLAFRIEARDPGRLDPHVRVGGDTFDVLSGRYDIEVLGEDRVLLHLTSTQRISSRLNVYVGWAVNAIMSDLQQTILRVIRDRSEGEPGTLRSRVGSE